MVSRSKKSVLVYLRKICMQAWDTGNVPDELDSSLNEAECVKPTPRGEPSALAMAIWIFDHCQFWQKIFLAKFIGHLLKISPESLMCRFHAPPFVDLMADGSVPCYMALNRSMMSAKICERELIFEGLVCALDKLPSSDVGFMIDGVSSKLLDELAVPLAWAAPPTSKFSFSFLCAVPFFALSSSLSKKRARASGFESLLLTARLSMEMDGARLAKEALSWDVAGRGEVFAYHGLKAVASGAFFSGLPSFNDLFSVDGFRASVSNGFKKGACLALHELDREYLMKTMLPGWVPESWVSEMSSGSFVECMLPYGWSPEFSAGLSDCCLASMLIEKTDADCHRQSSKCL